MIAFFSEKRMINMKGKTMNDVRGFAVFGRYVKNKTDDSAKESSVFSSGGRTRTSGLWVMSPTSYQLLHPAM